MSPEFCSGDFVLGLKRPFFRLRVGDAVLFRQPDHGSMIKRVTHIDRDQIFVEGSGIGSVDSRDFGALARSAIYAKVVWHFRD